MAEKIQLNDQVFNRDQYVKTIDTKFSEFGVAPIATPIDPGYTVYDFFKDYSRLLPSIPDEGEFNSKQYLIQRSGNYVYEEAINNTISELFLELTELIEVLVAKQQELAEVQINAATENLGQ
jgi:hypothetical protein